MRDLIAHSLRLVNNKLFILDQQKLPYEEIWIECQSPYDMSQMIKELKVRGAPLIGIAASLALAKYAETEVTNDEIVKAAKVLRASRPTAVNLSFCIDKQILAFKKTRNKQSIIDIAEALFKEDVILCNKIGEFGEQLLNNGDNILTHCNTGSLVTVGDGTALGVIYRAVENSKNLHVYVGETRPLLQGGRLTAWELYKFKIPYTLICDNMAASLMFQKKIQKVIVGADRIAKNGDFANKIGTYNLAVLATFHKIPFYVAAPYTSIDFTCNSGNEIEIEQRDINEVLTVKSNYGNAFVSKKESRVFNPAFDITPSNLVTAFILDSGVYKPTAIKNCREAVV